MILLQLLLIFMGLVFLGVVLVGAPYVPSKKNQIEIALDLLNLKPGQTLLELGAGDGRVAIAAARRGLKVVAYEINPVLAFIIYLKTRKYRKLIKIKVQDFWTTRWPKVDGIYIFSAELYMNRLNKKIIKDNLSLRVASFGFEIPGIKKDAFKEGIYFYDFNHKMDK